MSKQPKNDVFIYREVEDDGKNVTIEISEEDYRREKAAGVEDEALLKPGRYKTRRGGFIERHKLDKQRKRA